MEQLEREIHAFVVDALLLGQDDAAPERTASLVAAGVIDATGVLELVAFLEGRYGIRVRPDEVVPENLDSLERIAAFARRKIADRAGGSDEKAANRACQ